MAKNVLFRVKNARIAKHELSNNQKYLKILTNCIERKTKCGYLNFFM